MRTESVDNLFDRFGGSSALLLLDDSFASVSGFPLFTFQKQRPGVEVVGEKVARLLVRFVWLH